MSIIDKAMEWEWKGSENKDDNSGILRLEFSSGKASMILPDFGEAHYLANLIHNEIQLAERRGVTNAVAMYVKLSNEISNVA